MTNDIITTKQKMIQDMITSLQNNEKVAIRIGGYTIENQQDEINFQQARLDTMDWILLHTRAEIQTERDACAASLSPDELLCIQGIVRGLPIDTIAKISKIELLDIALNSEVV